MRNKRLKLPPHGKSIVDARNDGVPITSVWVIYGSDWTLPRKPGNPAIIIPKDWKPGSMDLSILVGLRADIVCRKGAFDAVGLGVELARYAAPVIIHWVTDEDDWPYPPGQKVSADLSVLAPHLEVSSKGKVSYRDGWTDVIGKDYADRVELFEEAMR